MSWASIHESQEFPLLETSSLVFTQNEREMFDVFANYPQRIDKKGLGYIFQPSL